MMVYTQKEFGIRPRKSSTNFRKQNYWTTQNNQDVRYAWDTKHAIRSRSEERPSQTETPSTRDYETLNFADDLRHYLLTSTLHGLRYIGEKRLTWFERFFWLAAFGCSLVCAAFFILNVYAKWRMTPMIVTINPENMPLNSLPFPAITICNVNQAKKSVAERYRDYGDSVDKKLLQSLCTNQEDTEIFENEIADSADWNHTRSFLINLIHEQSKIKYKFMIAEAHNFKSQYCIWGVDKQVLDSVMGKAIFCWSLFITGFFRCTDVMQYAPVTQPCNEMLSFCRWNSEIMHCQDLFNAQLTDEGLCCTFNVVHRNKMFRNPKSLNDMNITFPSPAVDWTPEDGYPSDAPPDGFPWRPKGIGTQHGLSVILDANIPEYYCASTKSVGFKILLHNPTETPKIRNLGEIYGPGIEARIAIQPRILDAVPTLRSIDINKRLCLFSSERELVFFRTYTLKNCEMECEARAMLDLCDCVLYYMPKNKTTRICGKADAKCYSNMTILTPKGRESACEECLPACTEIAYLERMSWAPLKKFLVEQLARGIGNISTEYFTENMLVIHFYFEDNTFVRFTKGEIFGLTEFLSNTGGLLGLCMGFSVMSAVELLYYLTLRALCLARQRRPQHPFTK